MNLAWKGEIWFEFPISFDCCAKKKSLINPNCNLTIFFYSEVILKEGFKCEYEPTYCKKHGALAYAIFPTNAFGRCEKKPTLHREFCQPKDDLQVRT